MGPFAVEGSTTWPRWVMSICPEATRRRAAARAGSMSGAHASESGGWIVPAAPATARAASEGQMVLSRPRWLRRSRMACSSCLSGGEGLCERQASEQNLTLSQSRSHFFRQVMERPQAAQFLGGCSGEAGCAFGLRSGMGCDAGLCCQMPVIRWWTMRHGSAKTCVAVPFLWPAFTSGFQPSSQVWSFPQGFALGWYGTRLWR